MFVWLEVVARRLPRDASGWRGLTAPRVPYFGVVKRSAFPVACLLLVGCLAAAEPEGTVVEAIHVGIEGNYKLGHWVPVGVTVRAGAAGFRGELTIEVPDANGVAAQFRGPSFSYAPHEVGRITRYVKFGQPDGGLHVLLGSTTGGTTRRYSKSDLPVPVATGQKLLLALGDDIGIEAAQAVRRARGSEALSDHRVRQFDELPRHWLGYSSVDVLVLATRDESLLTGIDEEQWSVIQRWVELGGTVVCGGAARVEEFFGGGGPLAGLAPGLIDGQRNQRQTSGIEQFTEATRRLDPIGANSSLSSIPMAIVRQPRGRVEASEGFGTQRSATVIRSSVGLGRVIFVAFDLDDPPFREWPDRSRLVAKLLDLAVTDEGQDDAARTGLGPLAHFGYSDLIGQLRHALDQFRGVRLIPFSWIAGLMALYIAIVGPVDFWVLRRWGRPEWTWLTFSLSVALFAGLGFVLAVTWKGTELRCNKATLVDIDVASGIVRGTAWSHLYSPRTCQVSLVEQPQPALNWIEPWRSVVSWQGLPGDGFGGLDRRESSESFRRPYQMVMDLDVPSGPSGKLEEYPIAVWSSQSLLGQWWGRVELKDDSSRLIMGEDGSLSGSVSNPLPFDLVDTYLVYDRWAIRLGTLGATQSRQISGATGVDLQALLSQRKVVNGRNAVTPWDANAVDVDRIMQLLLFYGAAKGRAYTRLRHAYQREVDWSEHLATGQAILWGRTDIRLDDILVDGQPVKLTDSWSYVRLMLPVDQTREN